MEIMRTEKSSRRCFLAVGGAVVVVAALFLYSCGNSHKRAEADLVNFIMRYEREMVPLVEKINHIGWKFAETGSLRYLNRLDSLRSLQIDYLHDAKSFAYLEKIRVKEDIKDVYLRRQADILYRRYRPCQGSVQVQKQLMRLDIWLHLQTWKRLRMRYIEKNIENLPHSSAEESRMLQKEWEIWKDGGHTVADSLLKMIRLRNDLAREAGYADYFAMRLDLDEIRASFMDSLLSDLKQATDAVYRQKKLEKDHFLAESFSIPLSRLRPWHYRGAFLRYGEYPVNQRKDSYYSYINIPDMVERFYSGIGFDLEDVLARSNLLHWGDKLPVFECLLAGDKNDIRIIGTISGTENDMYRLMGAAGKAIYLKYIPGTFPTLLRRPSSESVLCGVSAFFSRMTHYPAWILSMGILSVGQAGEIRGTTDEEFLRNQRLGCRWRLFLYDFEKQMYADPDRDLDSLWHALTREYFLLDIQPEQEREAEWAAEPYFVLASCQVANHLLGELWAAQVTDYLCRIDCRLKEPCDFNSVGNESVGKFFEKQVFAPGASLNWEELTEAATGEPLSLKAFVEQFK